VSGEVELPNGWALAAPPDIASDEKYALAIGPFGSNLKVSDYRDAGVPLVFVRNIRSEKFDGPGLKFVSPSKAAQLRAHSVQNGDVVITKMGDPPGDSALFVSSEPFAIITADCIKWRINSRVGIAKFFVYATRSIRVQSQIHAITAGVAQKKVSLARYGTVQYPVAPLNEQQRIVEAIESYFTRLDDAVATLERVERNLARYRASVLKAAVEGRLVPTEAELARREGRDYEPAHLLLSRILDERRARWERAELARMKAKGKVPTNDQWKARYQEPAPPDTSNLPDLPEGWCWATLDHFLMDIEAGKSFRCEERPPNDDEIGVVKVSAVSWGYFNEFESKTCTRRELVNESYFINPGDFLISRANTIELVGASVIVGTITHRLMLSDKILRLRTIGDLDWWLLWVLRSGLGRAQIEDLATGNQDSMRNIGQKNLRLIAIPLPPRAEAEALIKELERQVSMIDASERVVRANQTRCARLRQSILKWAFEGKLADQDPGDEPASVLLERIRAQRAGGAARHKPSASRKPRTRKTNKP
jgi:type I restriction enzyme S subunit